ncbi:hypothetical protein MIR68_009566 [Amoeboaphelidium protococcarum]|nr:hypothetical protein MIR68_009566 [Amoeboaphelidium protococcarum]
MIRAQTPMMQLLSRYIRTNGPISVADYMRMCLFHPEHGYYSTRQVFGQKGDFVTSPEISQVFGELTGAFMLNQAMQYSKFRYVELGAGRGTLLSDMLRVWQSGCNNIREHLDSINLVERSLELRKVQLQTLLRSFNLNTSEFDNNALSPELDLSQPVQNIKLQNGVTVNWYSDFEQIPLGYPIFLMAHEFFDALPFHQFKKVDGKWAEVGIDLDESIDASMPLRFGLLKGETPALQLAIQKLDRTSLEGLDTFEFSPEAVKIAAQIARLISVHDSGMAVVIDYGSQKTPSGSFRGVYKHQFVHPLQYPGESDLTVDVDFKLIQEEAVRQGDLLAPDVVTQREFLLSMGINERCAMLCKNQSAQVQREIMSQRDRLIAEDGMGTAYKVQLIKNSEPTPMPPFKIEKR